MTDGTAPPLSIVLSPGRPVGNESYLLAKVVYRVLKAGGGGTGEP